MIIAAADGSALGNPGPAGWAWYVDDDNWAAGGWKHATNNQGELTAVLELLRATAHLDEELLIQCDSQYVINTVSTWMPGWKRRGWKKADGKPVLNLDLVQALDAETAGRRYRFEWVRGHVGHVLNEAADARARAVAEAYRNGTSIPRGPGWTRDVEPAEAATRDALASVALTEETPSAPAGDSSGAESDEPTPSVAEPDDALFSFDSPERQWHEVTVELSADEHDRLLLRARAAGRSPEDFLRGLV